MIAAIQIMTIPLLGDQNNLDLSLKTYKENVNTKLTITAILTSYDDPDYGQEFANAIGNDAEILNLTETGEQLISWIPTEMAADLYNFNDEHIIGMETSVANNTKSFHTFFNGESYHAIATGVLYTDRTLAKSFFGDHNISISTNNFPLPARVQKFNSIFFDKSFIFTKISIFSTLLTATLAQSLQKNTSFTIQGSIISFNMVIGLMIMFSAFSMLPVRERSTGVKTMQRCSGSPQWIIWAGQFTWDVINTIPPSLAGYSDKHVFCR